MGLKKRKNNEQSCFGGLFVLNFEYPEAPHRNNVFCYSHTGGDVIVNDYSVCTFCGCYLKQSGDLKPDPSTQGGFVFFYTRKNYRQE